MKNIMKNFKLLFSIVFATRCLNYFLLNSDYPFQTSLFFLNFCTFFPICLHQLYKNKMSFEHYTTGVHLNWIFFLNLCENRETFGEWHPILKWHSIYFRPQFRFLLLGDWIQISFLFSFHSTHRDSIFDAGHIWLEGFQAFLRILNRRKTRDISLDRLNRNLAKVKW